MFVRRFLRDSSNQFIGDLLAKKALFAYSFRQLYANYSGFCITVQRSSDNALKDIGFTIDGLLDVVDLLEFVGSGDGFISRNYDLTGNGYHQTASVGSRPKIVSSGLLLTENGRPCALFDGVDDNFAATGVLNINAVSRSWSIVSRSSVPGKAIMGTPYDGAILLGIHSDRLTLPTAAIFFSPTGSQSIISANFNGSVGNLWLNGVFIGAANSLNIQLNNQNTRTGVDRVIPSTYYSGSISEQWFWEDNIDLALLEQNQKAYYGVI
jgi:hypothetical protein